MTNKLDISFAAAKKEGKGNDVLFSITPGKLAIYFS